MSWSYIDRSVKNFCVSHGLFIAQWHAYGFDWNMLQFINNYLSRRSQKTKAASSSSDFLDPIVFPMVLPRGSILQPIQLYVSAAKFMMT